MLATNKSESNHNFDTATASTHTKNKVFKKTLNIGSKNKIDPLKFYVLSPDNDGKSNTDMEVTEQKKGPTMKF